MDKSLYIDCLWYHYITLIQFAYSTFSLELDWYDTSVSCISYQCFDYNLDNIVSNFSYHIPVLWCWWYNSFYTITIINPSDLLSVGLAGAGPLTGLVVIINTKRRHCLARELRFSAEWRQQLKYCWWPGEERVTAVWCGDQQSCGTLHSQWNCCSVGITIKNRL